MSKVRFGLALATLLAACKPAVEPGPFLCSTNADCSPRWFCASDHHCHDQTKGERLACAADADCGGGWHCGAEAVCYDRADAGADLVCRRSLGSVDSGYHAGDCGDRFRCGVDGRCHPEADAGAIACAYAADFADCTNGWRCSFAGVCLDPATEALEPSPRGLSGPVLIHNVLPASSVSAISPGSVFEMAVATLDDAGLRLFQRLPRPPLAHNPERPEDFSGYDFIVTAFPMPGAVSGPIAAEVESVSFFQNGVLSRVRTPLDGGTRDAGPQPVLADDGGVLSLMPGAGQRWVSELRPLSNQELAAFHPGGGGYWRIDESGTGRWVDRPGFVELIDVPLGDLSRSCQLEALAYAPGLAALGVPPASECPMYDPVPEIPLVNGGIDRWRIQVGTLASPNPAIGPLPAIAFTGDVGGVSVDGIGFLVAGVPFMQLPGCSQVCGAGGHIQQFWPFQEEQKGPFLAEVLCQQGNDMSDRWWEVIRTAMPRCTEIRIPRRTADFLERHLDLPVAPGRNGFYTRYAPNFATGNGQVWVGAPNENRFGAATPWFADRPPLVLGEFRLPPLPDGGVSTAILSSGGNMTGVLTADGFVVRREDIGIVDGLQVPQGILTLTNAGELISPLEQKVYARVDLDPVPEQAELHTIAVARSDGGSEWVVSVDDQLFTGTASLEGRVVDLVAAARPASGFTIISMAPSYATAPDQAEFYVATRLSVFRIHLDALNRWRVDEVKLGSNLDYLEVWVTLGHRARAADRSGTVYSMPSGLRLSDAVPGGHAEDLTSTCGHDFALAHDDAYVLGPADGGTAQWQPLHLARDVFEGGRMYEVNDGLLIFGAGGEAQRIKCLGPP